MICRGKDPACPCNEGLRCRYVTDWQPMPEHAGDGRNLLESWNATLDDETSMTMEEHETFDRVPAERCKALTVRVVGRDAPFHVAVVPENGDRLRLFTRRAIKLGGGLTGREFNMPVIEVTNVNRPDAFTRLYIHPIHGPIFSTLNLEL